MDTGDLLKEVWNIIVGNPTPFVLIFIFFFTSGFGVCWNWWMRPQIGILKERIELLRDQLAFTTQRVNLRELELVNESAPSEELVDERSYRSLRIALIYKDVGVTKVIPLTPARIPKGNTMRNAILMINAITGTPSDVEYLSYDLGTKAWVEPKRVMDLSDNDEIVLVQNGIAESWGNDPRSAYEKIVVALSL